MRLFLNLVVITATLAGVAGAFAATPPAQPGKGPGGADYVATEVVKRAVGRASAATYVFHAAGTPAEPRPVVVFVHGWGATNPQAYGGWINHLARKGYLVLFPRFQEVNRTRPADATTTAVALLKEAFAALANDEQARPDLGKVAFVGHLAGAAIAVNLAAIAKSEGLPTPDLVYALMPGGIASDAKSRGVVLANLADIDPSTMIITVIGDRDAAASDRASKRILREAENVPANKKLFVRALSDDHGFPTLAATLSSPGAANPAFDAAQIKLPPDPPRDSKAPRDRGFRWSADMALTGEQTVLANQLNAAGTDTLDYLAYWKTFDMALEAAFSGKDAQALRDQASFVDMGRWSDGWPVRRLATETPRSEPAAAAGPRKTAAPSMMTVPSKKRR